MLLFLILMYFVVDYYQFGSQQEALASASVPVVEQRIQQALQQSSSVIVVRTSGGAIEGSNPIRFEYHTTTLKLTDVRTLALLAQDFKIVGPDKSLPKYSSLFDSVLDGGKRVSFSCPPTYTITTKGEYPMYLEFHGHEIYIGGMANYFWADLDRAFVNRLDGIFGFKSS
jgi:hypothetical protein